MFLAVSPFLLLQKMMNFWNAENSNVQIIFAEGAEVNVPVWQYV